MWIIAYDQLSKIRIERASFSAHTCSNKLHLSLEIMKSIKCHSLKDKMNLNSILTEKKERYITRRVNAKQCINLTCLPWVSSESDYLHALSCHTQFWAATHNSELPHTILSPRYVPWRKFHLWPLARSFHPMSTEYFELVWYTITLLWFILLEFI